MMNNFGRKIGSVGAALCFAAILGSCNKSDAQNDDAKKENIVLPNAEKIWTPNDNDRALSNTLNGFGFQMLQKFDKTKAPDANIVFSPLSISTALTLVEQGAAGKTRSEMEKLLQPAGFSANRVLDSTMALTRGWQTADSGVQVDIANSLWLDKKYTLKPAFVQMAKTNFDAKTATLDFSSPTSAKTINAWISGKTHDRIKDMISPDTLRAQMLVVANAVYFKGKWQLPFDKANTRDGDFHLASGKIMRAPMMSLSAEKTFSYAKKEKLALVALPYGKGHLSLILLLPDKGTTLSQIVSQCDSAQWERWINAMKVQEGTVEIPRFTLESDTTLNETLKQLGIVTAFSPNAADFSLMTTTKNVSISQVKHKAWMQVDESGTEAAAATTITMDGAAAMPAPKVQPFQFIADRPFLAAIRDNRSGNLLFLAEVNQPSPEK